MKHTLIITLILSTFFFLHSCDENSYVKVYAFNQNKIPSKPIEFEYTSVSSQEYYDIILDISHNQRIEHNQFVFDFKLNTEAGDSIATTLGILLRSQNGAFKGMQNVDTFTVSQVLMKKQRLPKGVNVFSITPAMNQDTIYNISKIALRIEESE